MARYYRSGRRYRRGYGGRYWRRSWWRRSVSSAQKQGTRRFSVSIPVEGVASAPVGNGTANSYVLGFQPFYNSNNANPAYPEYFKKNGNLVGNNLFSTYTQLYDEVKLNSVSLQLAVVGLPAQHTAVKVVTGVDRHCTLEDIRSAGTLANLMGSAESSSRMFTSLTNAKVYRYFRARDRQERETFVDSSLGTQAFSPAEGVTYNLGGLLEFMNCHSLYGALNPLISVGFSLAGNVAADSNVTFQYRVVWNLTFRNPKYGVTGAGRGDLFLRGEGDDEVKGESELDEETIKKLKGLLHEDVQLPLVDEDTRMSMDDDGDKDEKGS